MKLFVRMCSLVLALVLLCGMLPAIAPAAKAANTIQQGYTSAGSSLPFSEWEFEVLRRTNDERKANGLEPVTMFAGIQDACDVRARELTQLFSHSRPDGTDCWTALDEAGVNYAGAAENIAAGYGSPMSVVNGWMNSAGHRANILNASLKHMGVGYYYDGNTTYRHHWVQMFSTYYDETYTSATVYVPKDIVAGTSIDDMGIYAVLTNSYYGICYLPIGYEYLIGMDNGLVGTQTVYLSFLGFEGYIDVTLVPPEGFGILKQPSDVTVAEGQTATFSVEATGQDVTYQWEYRSPKYNEWLDTTARGYNTPTLRVTATKNHDGYEYRCRVVQNYEVLQLSEIATLTVRPAVSITEQPRSVTVAEGETAKVTVAAAGDGLSYRWYYKNPGDSGYTYTSSFTGNTYSVTMNAARNGRQVLCRIYDKYGNVVQTNTVKLSMKNVVKITQQPSSVTVANGVTAKVTVKATGDGLTYRWYFKDAGASGYTYTTSYTGNTYSVTMNEARNGRQVLCRVYDKYGNVVQTNTVKLSMQRTVKIIQQPTSVTVANGATAKVTVKATGDGLTYRWYYKNPGDSSYTYTASYTGNTYSVTMNEARNGRQILCRVYDKYGNVVQTNTVILRMS